MMKKRYFLAISLVFLLSCHNQETRKDGTVKSTSNLNKVLDSTIAVIDNCTYKVCLNQNMDLFVLNEKNDTIYKLPNRVSNGFEVVDYNEDGYKDILINQISNVGGMHELLLYDKKTRQFLAVENFTEFFSPERIQDTKYFYSYHRSGCAEANWNSDLFYLENFKAIKIGTISGRECESEVQKGTFIYKINAGKEILIEKLSTNDKRVLDKDAFIKAYWLENYKKFE